MKKGRLELYESPPSPGYQEVSSEIVIDAGIVAALGGYFSSIAEAAMEAATILGVILNGQRDGTLAAFA